jgi:Zn-dependent M16 (insulinase) family peptidase
MLLLVDTSASPLFQKFVELDEPLANDVDFGFKYFLKTGIVLIISNVPMDEINGGKPEKEILEKYKNILDELFHKVGHKEAKFITETSIKSSIRKNRIKHFESLEDDPHAVISALLLPDILNNYYLCDQKSDIVYGSRFDIPDMLSNLEKEPLVFWKDLFNYYFMTSSPNQVFMIPSINMIERLSNLRESEEQKRLPGIDYESKPNIPIDILATIPRFTSKNSSFCPGIEMKHSKEDSSIFPFTSIQTVSCQTNFITLKLFFSLLNLPDDLKDYIVLFQELLFQSPIVMKSGYQLSYTDLLNVISNDLVHHECGFGLGNETFSCSWLSEMFVVHGQIEIGTRETWKDYPFLYTEDLENEIEKSASVLASWLLAVVIQTTFLPERIKKVSKNLLSDISECKRDGAELLSSLSVRLSHGRKKSENTELEVAAGIFRQESFLKKVLQKIKNNKGNEIIEKLEAVKTFILGNSPSFIQMTSMSTINTEKIISNILKKNGVGKGSKRRFQTNEKLFPFPRKPFSRCSKEEEISNAYGVGGLSLSYVTQIIPCDVLCESNRNDIYAVLLLLELLNLSEGPLYTAIRGKGYAYGASLSIALWTGQLIFEASESSEPMKCIDEWLNILREWKGNYSDFELHTASCSVLYRLSAEISTPSGIMSQSLKASLLGYNSRDDYLSDREFMKVTNGKDIFFIQMI